MAPGAASGGVGECVGAEEGKWSPDAVIYSQGSLVGGGAGNLAATQYKNKIAASGSGAPAATLELEIIGQNDGSQKKRHIPILIPLSRYAL